MLFLVPQVQFPAAAAPVIFPARVGGVVEGWGGYDVTEDDFHFCFCAFSFSNFFRFFFWGGRTEIREIARGYSASFMPTLTLFVHQT